MTDTPEPNPVCFTVHSLTEGRAAAERIGFPLWIRPACTLRGHGTARCAHQAAFSEMLSYALTLSPTGEVQLDDGTAGAVVRRLGTMTVVIAGVEIAKLEVLDWSNEKNEALVQRLNDLVRAERVKSANLMRERCADAFKGLPAVALAVLQLPLPDD